MTQSLAKPRSFDEFLELYPEDGRYEFIDGELVRILATRQHDNVADFILFTLNDEINRLNLNYKVSDRIVIATRTPDGTERGRHPDMSVVNRELWRSNPQAYSALGEPLQLAVEVVSNNWEDDYIDKLDEYQRMGIQEYWIVDYLAIGSRNDIGSPKQPTVSVYYLTEGKYLINQFQGDKQIISRIFKEMTLTVAQILLA